MDNNTKIKFVQKLIDSTKNNEIKWNLGTSSQMNVFSTAYNKYIGEIDIMYNCNLGKIGLLYIFHSENVVIVAIINTKTNEKIVIDGDCSELESALFRLYNIVYNLLGFEKEPSIEESIKNYIIED